MDVFSILSEKFKYRFSLSNLSFLSKLFSTGSDENDINVQELYYKRLNFLIDSILNIRYKNGKSQFRFFDIADVNCYLQKSFSIISLDDICSEFYNFVNKVVSYDSLLSDINDLHSIFLDKGFVDLNDTHVFCNKILNLHRDSFFMNGRTEIYSSLSKQMKISNRVYQSFLNSVKMKKVSSLLSDSSFINSELYRSNYNRFRLGLFIDKSLGKYSFVVNKNFSKLMDVLNSNGFLDKDSIRNILSITDDDILNYICKKFNNFRYKFIDCVFTSSDSFSFDVSGVAFNYNNFLIFDNDRYINNLVSVLSTVSHSDLEHIISNRDYLSKFVYLISFVGLFDELGIEKFIDIMKYSRDIYLSGESVKNYSDLYYLSNRYSSINRLQFNALGKYVSSYIDINDSKEYFDFYLKMFKRDFSNIPPISFSMDGKSFESGVFSDLNRLLIGSKAGTYSCIKLGSPSFNDILLSPNNDVILVKKNGELVSRIFVFRRGNVVQLVTNFNTKFSIQVYEKICSELVSNSCGDNINFVFVNSSSCSNYNSLYPIISDNRFVTEFPYADLFNTSIKLYGDDYNLADYNIDCKRRYGKKRGSINFDASLSDVVRLRLFDFSIVNESDLDFNSLSYSKIICGDDWYIGLFSDGTYELFTLDCCVDSSYEEIEFVKNNFLSDRKLLLK